MIKTKRTVIIPFNMKYLDDYYNHFNSEITKYQWPDPFESLDSARSTLQDFSNEMEKEETLFCAILKNDQFIGGVEVHGLDGDCPELGVWIKSSEQNNGYAFEALDAVLDYVVNEKSKEEFFYEADVRNTASTKLLQKLAVKYDIQGRDTEQLITDSGKKLEMQGHILKLKTTLQQTGCNER